MAIITPNKTFVGSEMRQRTNTYIKSDIRTVNFGKDEKDGVYLFILGAYKTDSVGSGVWYKTVKIRDNFGVGMSKEKFAVQPNCPIDFFTNRVQSIAPAMAKPAKVQDDLGRERWSYPAWGRVAYRVLYNAAYFGKFEKGVHVLDLPQHGGASVIDEFVRGTGPDGTENPIINDYRNAIPLHIKLDLGASGQPWKIRIDNNKTFTLPEQLADTDYLYDLDSVVNYPDKNTLIEKLKSFVPPDIFRKGMEGYSGYVVESAPIQYRQEPTVPASETTEAEDNIPMSFSNPITAPKTKTVTVAPKVNIPKATNKPAPVEDAAALADDDTPLPSNPVAPSRVSAIQAAQNVLRGKAAANA